MTVLLLTSIQTLLLMIQFDYSKGSMPLPFPMLLGSVSTDFVVDYELVSMKSDVHPVGQQGVALITDPFNRPALMPVGMHDPHCQCTRVTDRLSRHTYAQDSHVAYQSAQSIYSCNRVTRFLG